MTAISISRRHYSQLVKHLLADKVEQVAFMYTEPPRDGQPLRVSDIYLVPPTGFDFQSHKHIELTDETRSRVIKRAHDVGGCLLEAHSHLGGPAQFSASDLIGFDDWVPHVRWRLRRKPYVALVFSGQAFDALVWDGEDRLPRPLRSLEIDGRPPREPSGTTYQLLTRQRS